MGSILVTGAGSGIGLATALDLSSRGYTVYGGTVDQAEADRITEQTGQAFSVLPFNLCSEVEIRSAIHLIEDRLAGGGLAAVVHCAGIAVPGPLSRLPLEQISMQMETNVFGSLRLARESLPLLRLHNPDPGRFIQISALSGQLTLPFLAAFAMSEHALEAMIDGLRREWMSYGISVCSILLDKVQTPMADRLVRDIRAWATDPEFGEMMKNLAEEYERKRFLPIERVVQAIRHAITDPNPRSRWVLRGGWLSHSFLLKMLPERWGDRIIFRTLGGTYR